MNILTTTSPVARGLAAPMHVMVEGRRAYLDLDDTLLHTQKLSIPVFEGKLYPVIQAVIASLPAATYDKVSRILRCPANEMTWMQFLRLSKVLSRRTGSHLQGWEALLEQPQGWNHAVFDGLIPYLEEAILGKAVLEEGIIEGIEELRRERFDVCIITHNHLRLSLSMIEAYALPFVKEDIYDSIMMTGKPKSTVAPYLDVRKRRGAVGYETMSDDSLSNLKVLRSIGINGYWITKNTPREADLVHFHHHYQSLVPAMKDMIVRAPR